MEILYKKATIEPGGLYMAIKLVEVHRADITESIHRGVVAVVNSKGEILHELGDSRSQTFFRSAAKPLQAITVLQSGITEKFKLDLREIALIASSHSGEPEHIEVLKQLMEKVGIAEEQFECGIHEPVNKDALKELLKEGKSPSKLHCNCSGKHLGIIAAAKIKGWPEVGYSRMDHAIQEEIVNVISEFSNIESEKIIKGTDGCGIPVYGIPLKNMALAYANLCDLEFMKGAYKKSQKLYIECHDDVS